MNNTIPANQDKMMWITNRILKWVKSWRSYPMWLIILLPSLIDIDAAKNFFYLRIMGGNPIIAGGQPILLN